MAVEEIQATETGAAEPLRLDLGCGQNKRSPGFVGVDSLALTGVDIVHDLTQPWPWEDDSVTEIHASHFLEHFDPLDRCHIVNEMWRVLKVGGTVTIICPHWSSCRAYGDPTHKWPPMGEFWFNYVNKNWRSTQAPHTDADNVPGMYRCNFAGTQGSNMHPEVALMADEKRNHFLTWCKEASQDILINLTKIPMDQIH